MPLDVREGKDGILVRILIIALNFFETIAVNVQKYPKFGKSVKNATYLSKCLDHHFCNTFAS